MNWKLTGQACNAVLAVVALVAGASLAWGQSSNASIVGTVHDKSGAVVPGVTVTATSPALQTGAMSVVTDETGEYRISPLPIGTYVITYELAGFDTVKQPDVRLTVGFVATVNAVLSVSGVAEAVTVSGASAIVDAVSTAATTQMTRETLETIPGSRNGLISVLSSAPGVRTTKEVGGSATNEQTQFRSFGQSGEAWNLVEGVYTLAPQNPGAGGAGASGGAGNYFDFNAFDESAISTLGNGAKTPTRGVQIVSIVKSGGNDLHGGFAFGQYMTDWQADNLTDELMAQGVTSGNPTVTRYDYGGDLGGKIGTSKLWFYTAARRRRDVEEIAGTYQPNGDAAVDDQLAWWATGKVSYQASKTHKLVGFYQEMHKWDESGADTLRAWESRQEQSTIPKVGKVEWQWLRGNSMVVDLQYGFWNYEVRRYDVTHGPRPDETLPGISMTDAITQKIWGENTNVNTFVIPDRKHTKGTLTWYKPDVFFGNHQVDTGFDYLHTSTSRGGNERNQPAYQLEYQNGVPFQFRTQNIPVEPFQVTEYLGLYVQDVWTIARRVTMNLGLRYARDKGYVPEACREAGMFAAEQCWPEIQMNTWNSFAPRMHAAWDLTGNAKSVLKFGWGHFVHMRANEPEVQDLDPKATQTTIWRWHDLNGNKLYEPGEVDLRPGGPDYVSGVSGSTFFVNPDEKPPTVNEFSASFERQLAAGFAARLTGIHSRTADTLRVTNPLRPPSAYTVPVSRPDPGPDGVVGNADDTGNTLTYWEYPQALAGAAFDKFTRVNDSRADTQFTSFEFAVVKRFSRGWQFSGSYSATKFNGNLGSNGALGPADNPNAEIMIADHTWEYGLKLAGSYQLPWTVMVSANYDLRSGDPWARTVRVTGGRTIPNFTMPVEEVGTRRMDKFSLLDMRLQKQVRIARTHKLDLRANIYNVLNANSVQNVQRRSGSTFGLPIADGNGTTILPPRILELSVAYTF